MEFESILLKPDTPDRNGRIYSKEALKKAVEEYNSRVHSKDEGVDHKSSEFSLDELNEIYKHDDVDTSKVAIPYSKPVVTDELIKKINEIHNDPNFKPDSWVVYGGLNKKVIVK